MRLITVNLSWVRAAPYNWASNGNAWLVQAFVRLIAVNLSWVRAAPYSWASNGDAWLVQAFSRLITVVLTVRTIDGD